MGLTILLIGFTALEPEAKSLLLLLWFSGFHCLCLSVMFTHENEAERCHDRLFINIKYPGY